MTSTLAAFTLFAVVAGFTPGPNNLMVAASGATYGYRRSQAHLAGVVIGFPILMIGVGAGLGSLFLRYPVMHGILKVTGSVYLLYLSWKIASASLDSSGRSGRPLSFLQAAMFQWVNPKGWITVLASITTFTHPVQPFHVQLGMLALISLLVTLLSIHTWCLFGAGIGKFLAARPVRLRVFNICMGLLLAASLIQVWAT
jgi:threonine/homoserine/homoserine lactone efflux protein